jgi:hypothetical protein
VRFSALGFSALGPRHPILRGMIRLAGLYRRQ